MYKRQAEDLLIGHPLGTQRDRFKYLSAVIEVIEGLVLKISCLLYTSCFKGRFLPTIQPQLVQWEGFGKSWKN